MLIIIAVIVLVGLYIIITQKRFVHVDEICKNAESTIKVNQLARYNALTKLAQAAKTYRIHEKETLIEVIEKRRLEGNVVEAEKALNEGIGKLIAIAENYPNLKADALFLEAMDAIRSEEEKVSDAKYIYNDSVTKWNRLIRSVTTGIVALVLGYKKREYIEIAEKYQAYPELEF